MSPLILLNGYLVKAMTNFWNPNISLIFSFIFFILLYEYIDKKSNKKTVISSIFIFPVLAIIAQGHFASFFSVIPSMIFYLIVTYKNTIKYLKYWILGIFLSFLLYLPYLISEINNSFINTKSMMSKGYGVSRIIVAKVQALFLFPTNEMSSHYLQGLKNIIEFWTSSPSYIYGLIFLVLSIIFSLYCLINMLYYVFNFKYKAKTSYEGTILELSRFFILSVFSTLLCFNTFKFGEGYFHYLYGLFSVSYSPIILFFVQKENYILNNKKIFFALVIFLILNAAAMFGTIDRYVNRFERNSSNKHNIYIEDFLKTKEKY